MSSFKVLAPLTASSGANIVNGLAVSGTSSLAAVTATTVSGSGAGSFGGGLNVAGTSALAAVTATSVSSSGQVDVGGALNVAGASALAGLTATSVSASSTLQAGGAATLGSTLSIAGLATAQSGLIVSGSSELSGAVLFKSDTFINNVLSTASLNDLTGTLNTIVNAIFNNAGISAANATNAYHDVRFANGEVFPAGGTNEVYVWLAEGPVGQSNFTNVAQSPSMTGSTVQGLSGSTAAALLDQMKYVSFDVKTRASGSSVWTNDLVSVDVSAQQSGSDYYPVFTISAPGLGEGNGLHQFSLVVVNEGMPAVGGYEPQS